MSISPTTLKTNIAAQAELITSALSYFDSVSIHKAGALELVRAKLVDTFHQLQSFPLLTPQFFLPEHAERAGSVAALLRMLTLYSDFLVLNGATIGKAKVVSNSNEAIVVSSSNEAIAVSDSNAVIFIAELRADIITRITRAHSTIYNFKAVRLSQGLTISLESLIVLCILVPSHALEEIRVAACNLTSPADLRHLYNRLYAIK